jgi:hypothetical protein
MMGRAIPHEPLQPLGPDEPLSADKLQAIARRLVDEAIAGDLSAMKRSTASTARADCGRRKR